MYSRIPLMLIFALGCAGDPDPATVDAPTYYGDAKSVMDASCTSCHLPGGIAPFSMETLDDILPWTAAIRNAVDEGSMPPWQGAEGCNDYANDFSLSADDKQLLLDWIDADTPEGDPADAVQSVPAEAFPVDLLLTLPEPFTPKTRPDDYRCQIIPWPETETTYITGLRVEPDQASMVHHTIVYAVPGETADQYYALDAAEDGPGYTCFGGPTGESDNPFEDMTTEDLLDLMNNAEAGNGPASDQRWIGAWVPGVAARPFPEGTGLKMTPGDLLIVQMHYNTDNTEPTADQSSIGFRLANAVEREATVLPLTDLGWVTEMALLGDPMTIPEGESSVQHSTTIAGDSLFFAAARRELGLAEDGQLQVHSAGHHMHQLGSTGYQEIRHANGDTTCMVDIPEWDFGWQGAFSFAQPVLLSPDDEVLLTCGFDNSQANQPVVNGEQQQSRDVAWGEGSTDEMCLSTLYLTAP